MTLLTDTLRYAYQRVEEGRIPRCHYSPSPTSRLVNDVSPRIPVVEFNEGAIEGSRAREAVDLEKDGNAGSEWSTFN
jgi:hypothetical protein